jgi:hypothetical protein
MTAERRVSRALIVSVVITALSIIALVFAFLPSTPMAVEAVLVFIVLPSVAVAGMIAIIAFRMDAQPRRLAIVAIIAASAIFVLFFVVAILDILVFGRN